VLAPFTPEQVAQIDQLTPQMGEAVERWLAQGAA